MTNKLRRNLLEYWNEEILLVRKAVLRNHTALSVIELQKAVEKVNELVQIYKLLYGQKEKEVADPQQLKF